MNDAIEMGMLSGCSYVKQWEYAGDSLGLLSIRVDSTEYACVSRFPNVVGGG